jgi:hypothetical protein
MKNCYQAVFLIPVSTKKILGDTGWLFKTENRLRPEILDVLKSFFVLEEKETYLGIVAYIGNGIKVNVIYDEVGLIEQISVQLWTKTIEELTKILYDEGFDDVEIFVPKED